MPLLLIPSGTPPAPSSTNTTSPITTDDLSGYAKLAYPNDLTTNPNAYGENFCVFFINVRGNSLLTQNNNYIKTVDGKPVTSVSAQGKTGMSLSGQSKVGPQGAQTKRTSTCISLYMPTNISMDHNVEWENKNLGYMGGYLNLNNTLSGTEIAKEGGAIAADSLGTIVGLAGKVIPFLSENASGLSKGLGFAGSNMPDTTVIRDLASASFGQSINTHKEMLFKGVDFRRLALEFDFYPRSLSEQENVAQIIDLFRFHMHPELADQNATARFFLYPSEFDISFYHGSQLNRYMFALSSTALTKVTVNYTGPGLFVTHATGGPVGIKLTLDFTELEILTKNRLAELEFNRTDFKGLVPSAQVYNAK